MYDTYELFVRGNCEYPNLVNTIQRLTGETFERVEEYNEIKYKAKYQLVYITIYINHDIEDHLNMKFSKYNYYASFGTYGGDMTDGVTSHQACKDLAIQTGECLCHEHNCECMVTENFETLIQLIVIGSEVDQPSNGE
jgi:hypothetical protein